VARRFLLEPVPAWTLFDLLEDGAPLDEFLTGFPNITKAHAVAMLVLAKNAAETASISVTPDLTPARQIL
jgi:uncharacterized protein (DUF433 family)